MNEENKNDQATESLDSSLETSSEDQTTVLSDNQTPEHDETTVKTEKQKLDTPNKLKSILAQKSSIYLYLFFILIIGLGVIAILEYSHSNKNNNVTFKQETLTPAALQRLATTNTNIGSSNSLLTIQSNSVFNNPVLMRSNLQVAGNLQLGGTLNLTQLTVSGNSALNQVQIAKNLSVIGAANVQNGLNVQNNLSVNGNGTFSGGISAPQITTTSLTLNGDLNLSHHIIANGSIPSQSSTGAVGGGGTTSINGSDTAGTITINTGSNPSQGCYLNIAFAASYNSPPNILITPIGASSANLNYYINRSSSGFSVCSTTTPNPATTYSYDYFVIG